MPAYTYPVPYPDTAPVLEVPAVCVISSNGLFGFIFLVALPIAVFLTWLTVVLYRHYVRQAMGQVADTGAISRALYRSGGMPPARALQFDVVDTSVALPKPALAGVAAEGVERASFAYAVAGLVHALIGASLTVGLDDLAFLPVHFGSLLLLYAWPVIPALIVVRVGDARSKWNLLTGYFALLLVLDALSLTLGFTDGVGLGRILLTWAFWMGIPSLLLWILNNRAWRSVGLFAYFVAVSLVVAVLLATQGLGCLALTLGDIRLWSDYRYVVWLGLLLILLLAVWGTLRYVAQRYRLKQTSIQTLTLDSWWLVITLSEIIIQFEPTQGGSVSLILTFVAYKLISSHLLRRKADEKQPKPASLLLLRVFGHRLRSRQLLDQLSQRWSFIGPISLISAPDLAATNLEPDELLQFWGLRLRNLFVASEEDLQRRLGSFDAKPDPDGRYRINEFFCYDNTWKATVHALAMRSDAVLMDLRGFGEHNKGCSFELGLLLAEVPLARVVLLVDATTQRDALLRLLEELWQQLPADSVNRTLAEPRLCLFHAPPALHSVEPLLLRVAAAVG